MRKNFGKDNAVYPMPVFIVAAFDKDGKANCMNAAWGGIYDTNQVMVCISEGHKTTKNILETKAFTVNIADARHVVEADYVGIASGNKEPDKFSKAGFHATKSEFVDAPLIDELAIAVECNLISYDVETCRLIGEIVNVSVDESVLDENGKVDITKVQPIIFDAFNLTYHKVGEKVGKAFKDGLQLK